MFTRGSTWCECVGDARTYMDLHIHLYPANKYVESKCEAVIQEMRRCCALHPPGRSICCSGFQKEDEAKSGARKPVADATSPGSLE
ncbi:hypothetical protein NDU88_007487 [Pleurodeles waltl]|uniref:Cx9C motif-containing protein 4 n=1 Tax=Pleurodeles waltl TaxID=8319 RepID=A0AAV7MJA6_PLEWA|nr:hypothetical protein NDU88_007487 [Pleurodeles waltl]